jgi:hypothetical protein
MYTNTTVLYGTVFKNKYTALNSSSASRYSVNSTIKDLLDQLMIEHWYSSLIYENYYTACHPVTCTYTYETRNNVFSLPLH